eukprot:TRINITY_DN8770_c0_g1_i1.p1 TRINITY_DN8770_c0_g1~~TRINITY_DN8770_c0_g1_i1.p1  ORF type:complete len:168 (-),score=31.18 TRINITY_DN8770_c0_g1_i1:394-897(-)
MLVLYLAASTKLVSQGVVATLEHELSGETANGVDMKLMDVENVLMYMVYFRGSFESQLFISESSLRRFYEQVGDFRFRVQNSKTKPCVRNVVPAFLMPPEQMMRPRQMRSLHTARPIERAQVMEGVLKEKMPPQQMILPRQTMRCVHSQTSRKSLSPGERAQATDAT